MSNIVNQNYWNQQYKDVFFSTLDKDHYLRTYINKYIPVNNEGQAFEIGCYPCRYLSLFGELGYELNGVDLNPDTLLLNDIVKKSAFKVGKISQADFLNLDEHIKYDIVSSFGFVEHFTNLEDILIKHANIVAPNGFLIIETPNFNGWIQYLFHYLYDTPNLKRHIKKNMDPFYWKELLNKNGFDFEYLCCEYCGGIDFWTDKDQPKIQNFFAKIAKRIWWGIKFVLPFIPFSKINSKAASRSCILIAKKRVF